MEFFLSHWDSLSTTGHCKLKFKYRRGFKVQLLKVKEHLEEESQLDPRHCFSPEKIRPVGPFRFLPLVTVACNKIIDLDITVLSHCEPCCGKSFPTGDIDNMLKVILDALRIAQTVNEVRSETPGIDEDPFLCLMEDDQLVRKITIEHQKLFFPKVERINAKEVFVLIKVIILPKFQHCL